MLDEASTQNLAILVRFTIEHDIDCPSLIHVNMGGTSAIKIGLFKNKA
jgi:hypothetical protein